MTKKLIVFGREEEAKRLSDILAGRTAFMTERNSPKIVLEEPQNAIPIILPQYEQVNLEDDRLY